MTGEEERRYGMQEVDLYIEVPSGIKQRKAHSAWRIVYYCRDGQQAVIGGYPFLDVTPNAAAIITLRLALERLKYGCEVHVWTNNKLLGAALENGWVKSWADNDWANRQGKEVANKALWHRTEWEMRRHRVTGKYIDSHSAKVEMRKEMKRLDEETKETRQEHPAGAGR